MLRVLNRRRLALPRRKNRYMSEPRHIAVYRKSNLTYPAKPVSARNAPGIVKCVGPAAEFAWEEFFQGELANPYTRKNYIHAIKKFLAWCEERNLQLIRVTPGDVGAYFQELPLAILPRSSIWRHSASFSTGCSTGT
jgi:hypothetical protein